MIKIRLWIMDIRDLSTIKRRPTFGKERENHGLLNHKFIEHLL
jgi:hypothetical protein